MLLYSVCSAITTRTSNLIPGMHVVYTVFELSGIASQNATQIDPPCDSKCHVSHLSAMQKKPEVV